MTEQKIHIEAKESYDKIAEKNENERLELPFRSYNNFVKTQLIQYATYCVRNRPLHVLDLACGRGGDIFKWLYNTNIFKYEGYDISESSIKEAKKRVEKSNTLNGRKKAMITIEKQNCFTKEFLDTMRSSCFEIISCQFALHYGLSSLEFTKYFFRQIARLLVPNGLFIGTIVDHTKLVTNGNDLFSIKFNSQNDKEDAVNGVHFGISYEFRMNGHVESHEYVIPWDKMVECAESEGLYIIVERSVLFKKYEEQWKYENRIFSSNNNLSQDEKDLINIYKTFMFYKPM